MMVGKFSSKNQKVQTHFLYTFKNIITNASQAKTTQLK